MMHRFSSVPADLDTAVVPPRFASETVIPAPMPHQIECEVQRALMSHPHLRFSSLVVRRLENGVCLTGVLEADDDAPDVVSIAQRVQGVDQVLNRLLVSEKCRPQKG
jgi:osmotically-inducible protein OsmY